jgi:hypothetical protein
VMRAQLEHPLRLTELPNVTLQIVPFHACGSRPGPARSGLSRTTQQRAVPRPARRRHWLRDRHGPAVRAGRDRRRQQRHAEGTAETDLSPSLTSRGLRRSCGQAQIRSGSRELTRRPTRPPHQDPRQREQ